eukprot:540460_1
MSNIALTELNNWFESLTIPSIESLISQYGDILCRSLCKIIQKSTNPIFKKQAIRVLGKLGGNNRNFLEKSSSIKHEQSTQPSITLDFVVTNSNQPNIIDISFSNIIDEALNLIIKKILIIIKNAMKMILHNYHLHNHHLHKYNKDPYPHELLFVPPKEKLYKYYNNIKWNN